MEHLSPGLVGNQFCEFQNVQRKVPRPGDKYTWQSPGVEGHVEHLAGPPGEGDTYAVRVTHFSAKPLEEPLQVHFNATETGRITGFRLSHGYQKAVSDHPNQWYSVVARWLGVLKNHFAQGDNTP